MLVFFDILDSMVSISSGSAAAKIIASTSLSPIFYLDGNETILSFKLILLFLVFFIYFL